MTRVRARLPLYLYTLTVGVVLAVLMSACQRPVTIVTPQGKVAYAAHEVAIRVGELQKATIAAETAGAIPTAVARIIITFTTESAKVLGATPSGWGGVVATRWGNVKRQLPLRYLENPAIIAAVSAVDIALAIFLPPEGTT
jgi:hypothetical protein